MAVNATRAFLYVRICMIRWYVAPSEIDWSGASHVTDAEIFKYLCEVRGRDEPSADQMARARSQFVDRLTASLEENPNRFRFEFTD